MNLGLKQQITVPSHTKGNILDILLTNFDNSLSNVNVMSHLSVCYSDHFPITFNVLGRLRRKNLPKREFYNFKKADWKALSIDLSKVDWDSRLSHSNIETNWEFFKKYSSKQTYSKNKN